MNIELTKEQVKNLKIFLSRVQLSGNEVEAFVEILKKLEEKPKEDGKK